jgi:hypothetical protein
MGTLAIVAGLLLAQGTPTIVAEAPQAEEPEVGYRALLQGQPAEAIAQIRANWQLASSDPAALINLGTAHARMGDRARAEGYYLTAIGSRERYDLQLADGSWMDSRAAARTAIARLGRAEMLAVR